MHKQLTSTRLSIYGFAFSLMLLLSLSPAFAQDQKVANYATGRAGTRGYEHLSFWLRGNKLDEIDYGFGKDWSVKEVKMTYLGRDIIKGEAGFRLRFPDGHMLLIIPKGSSLKVIDSENNFVRYFRWEYEGPVNGRGTFCDVCAQDAREAMRLVRRYLMR